MIKLNTLVKSKKLIKGEGHVGIVCMTAWTEAFVEVVKKVGFKETYDFACGVERWLKEYPESCSEICLVLFDREVENSVGKKGKDFWVPIGDLEEVEGEMA